MMLPMMLCSTLLPTWTPHKLGATTQHHHVRERRRWSLRAAYASQLARRWPRRRSARARIEHNAFRSTPNEHTSPTVISVRISSTHASVLCSRVLTNNYNVVQAPEFGRIDLTSSSAHAAQKYAFNTAASPHGGGTSSISCTAVESTSKHQRHHAGASGGQPFHRKGSLECEWLREATSGFVKPLVREDTRASRDPRRPVDAPPRCSTLPDFIAAHTDKPSGQRQR